MIASQLVLQALYINGVQSVGMPNISLQHLDSFIPVESEHAIPRAVASDLAYLNRDECE